MRSKGKFDKPRALVTGGAGFLGSHLCERLLHDDFEVLCLDNFFTGQRKNILHLIKNPYFSVIHHDVCYPYSIDTDFIFNLACPASPPYYQFDPVKTINTNILGAINMLELARQTEARILQASTSEIYGDPLVHPQLESYWGNVNPIGVRSCYDEGKRCAETLFFDYHRQYNVDIKVVRIFNTYGPQMHPNDGRVVSNFIMQALRNEDITIYGDGLQTRSFCYVEDLINAFIAIIHSPPDFQGPVNIGNPGEFTMLELAEKVIEFTFSNSNIVFRPLPSDDPKQRKPDISLAYKKLSWEPMIQLDEGLKRTIDYFKSL